jgi:hypothetical protein
MDYEETVKFIGQLCKAQEEKCVNLVERFKQNIPEAERKKYYFLYDLCNGWKPLNMSVPDGFRNTSTDSIAYIFEEYGNDAVYRSIFPAEVLASGCSQSAWSAYDIEEFSKEISAAKSPEIILEERLKRYKETGDNDKEIADARKMYNEFIDEIKQSLQNKKKSQCQIQSPTAAHEVQTK